MSKKNKKNKENKKTIYFAYGSNMSPLQMNRRCPTSKVLGKAILHNYEFVIEGRGFASVDYSVGGNTHGVLWLVPNHEIRTLDAFEGVSNKTYIKKCINVDYDGESIKALVYIATDKDIGEPTDDYLHRILYGAVKFGLPSKYIEYLESFKGRYSNPSSLSRVYNFPKQSNPKVHKVYNPIKNWEWQPNKK